MRAAPPLSRALHENLGVPTQVIGYSDGGHDLTTCVHSNAKLQGEPAWCEMYLLVARTDE